jgi:hypothetical protein
MPSTEQFKEEDWYDAGERLLTERNVWPNGMMSQLALYAEIAYLLAWKAAHEQA